MVSSLIFSEIKLRVIIPLRDFTLSSQSAPPISQRFGDSYLLTLVCQAIALQSNLDCTVEQALLFRCDNEHLRSIISHAQPNDPNSAWLYNAFYSLRRYLRPQAETFFHQEEFLVKVKGRSVIIELYEMGDRARGR